MCIRDRFWADVYAAYPGIAPEPVASMRDLAIATDPRSLPAVSDGSHEADTLVPGCVNCGSSDASHEDTRSRWIGGHDGYADTQTVHRCDPCQQQERPTTAIVVAHEAMTFDIEWPMPDDLVRALIGFANGGDYTGARSSCFDRPAAFAEEVPAYRVLDTRQERVARYSVSESDIAARMPVFAPPPSCRLCGSFACPGC